MLTFRSALKLAAVAMALPCGMALAAPTIDSNTFGGLRARDIGSARMSGRIAAMDVVATDPLTLYVGSASGGVWKSRDAGVSFRPIFDDHAMSIGAIAVDPSNPKNVWVGTGESWVRNSVSVGDGVYKSTDGGDTWTNLGLKDSERIGAIRVHPKNGDIVYVCATGHLWDDNEERGLYKTSDGGKTWERILYVDAKTGCADIDIDPQEPDIVYAAMWQFRRWGYFFESGGPGSALYRSKDGGSTFEKLTKGLPEGNLGRIAIAVAPSRPNVVYANVEAEKTALYRSDDLGTTWTQTDSSFNVTIRPFYFSELVIDPTDHNRVYKPGLSLGISVDGGKSFGSVMSGGLGGGVHSDHHALWINPKNPHELFLGTDGGIYASSNRGNSWRHVKSLPISQFYHVAFDHELPYNVYGGLQDNGTWTAPSAGPAGISNADWRNTGFGDGFWSFADPTDNDIIYSEYQGGQLLRYERDTGALKRIKPYKTTGQEALRFNWNTPIHLSPNDPATLYFGSQYLHRSRDRGDTWETISPDLTTDDPARQKQNESGGLSKENTTAENHCTIFAIAESPKDAQVIWAGTDDGNLQVTRDGGKTWTLLNGNLPDVPKNAWVSSIQASTYEAGTAFVTFDNHTTGDKKPYAYRTGDFGATWQSIVAEPVAGWAHVVKQDPVNPALLYLGTEFGLWISPNGGAQWARFKENLPKVAVRDLVIHPRDNDLVIATHGRGVYIIDDLTPLRHLTAEVLESEVALLPSEPARMALTSQIQEFAVDDEFVGENPSEAAGISYFLKKRHLIGDLKIEVYNEKGELLATLPGEKRPGLNRVDWPMRLKPPTMPAATNLVPAFIGPRLLEGTYNVKLIKGKTTVDGKVELVPDPRIKGSREDRLLQQQTTLDLYHGLGELTFLTDQLIHLRDGARKAAADLKSKSAKEAANASADRLEKIRAKMVSTDVGGIFSGDEKLREELANLYGDISAFDGRPTNSQLAEKDRLLGDLAKAEQEIEAAIAAELKKINALLQGAKLPPLTPLDRKTWEAKSGTTSAAALADAYFAVQLPTYLRLAF